MASVRAGVIVLSMLLCLVDLHAQKERVLPRRGSSSLEGVEFVVGFMQNEVSEADGTTALSLFFSSEYPATVVIEFPDGQRLVERLVQHTVRVITVSDYFEVEESEISVAKAIFITSNYPITVYAMNARQQSTDTYAALPIPKLGTDYYSVNRPNDHYRYGGPSEAIDTMARGGELMILATEANTSVTITPACKTEAGNPRGVPYTTTLQKGECYLVRGAPDVIGSNDLTGSHIVSDKPIALLSGHMRSGIPTAMTSTKDHLVEMLPDVKHYGTEFATAPFAVAQGGDYFRVVASADNTNVEYVDVFGTHNIQLNRAGDWSQVRLSAPAHWTSDNPCLLVQFMASSQSPVQYDTLHLDFDPAMVVVPSMSQFVMGALFQFPILATQKMSNQPRHYYVNIVADSVAVPSLAINGVPLLTLAPGVWSQTIPGTSLRWSQVRLQQGVVAIACDTGTFSGVMYGCSYADSYANLFGIRFDPLRKLDLSPPVYTMSVDCGNVTGSVTDVSADSAKMEEVIVQSPPTRNYSFSVSDELDSIGRREINASVMDMWNDAILAIHSYDKQGNGKEWLYVYDAPKIRLPANPAISLVGTSAACLETWIVNIDSTPVRIKRLGLQADPRYTLLSLPTLDTLLAPGDSVSVTICFQPSDDTVRRTARVQVFLPCGLHRDFTVRTSSTLSITGGSIDFGPVRIGDTVCGFVPVINDGINPIDVQSIHLNVVLPEFTADTLQLGLPRLLNPGDTMWVRVCFTPNDLGTYTREDSVHTVQGIGTQIGYTGRGARPDVKDVVIDWGKRRIGLSYDTLITLRNFGDAACMFMRATATGDAGYFNLGTFGIDATHLLATDSSAGNVTFSPTSEITYAARVPIQIDWRYHDSVHVSFTGVGIMPAVETYDVDMGAIAIGLQRDSVVDLIRSFGTEPLTISSITRQGADQGAFVLPGSLSTLRRMSNPELLTDRITFIPSHVGYHEVVVAVEHDAMPGTAKDTSYIKVFGMGFNPDTVDFRAELRVASVLDVCVDTSATIVMQNHGNTVCIVKGIELLADGTPLYTDSITPFFLEPDSARAITVKFTPDRHWSGQLQATIRSDDTSVIVREASFVLRIPVLEIASTPQLAISPGAPISITTHVRSSATQHIETSLHGTYTVPPERLVLSLTGPITGSVTDALGADRTVPMTITRMAAENYRWTLDGPVLSPFHVTWTVGANSLWKDTKDFEVLCNVDSTSCADGNQGATTITNELCAGSLRSVRFAVVPKVSVTVAPNPVTEELDIEALASENTEISLYLISATGERYVVAERILLIKGNQHVKFSRSQWASGLYWLVLQLGDAEAGLPVMLVN